MSARLDYHALAPKPFKALSQLSYASGSTVGPRLKELVNLAFCIDMHWADLLRHAVDPRHVNAVAGWREAQRFFDGRDRAALNWEEAVNAVPHRTPSGEDFALVKEFFTDEEIADLTFCVGAICAWNMLNASFHTQVVSADVKLTHCAEVKVTHLGDDGGFLAVDVDPGASSGDTCDGPQGRGNQGDREAARLLRQHRAAVLA